MDASKIDFNYVPTIDNLPKVPTIKDTQVYNTIDIIKFDDVYKYAGDQIGYVSKYPTYATWRDNEDYYAQKQTGWDKFGNTMTNLITLGAGAFVQAAAELPVMINAMAQKDWSKLHDNPFAEGMAQKMTAMSYLNPIYETKEQQLMNIAKGDSALENSWLSLKQYVPFTGRASNAWANLGSQLGFTLGTIAYLGAETAALGLLTAEIGGAAGWAKLPLNIQKAFKTIAFSKNIVTGTEVAKSALQAGSTFAKGRELIQTGKALQTGFNVTIKGTQAFKTALAEGGMEGAMTAMEVKEEALQKIYDEGRIPTTQEILEIEDKAKRAGNITLNFNIPILMMSNAITLGRFMSKGATNSIKNPLTDILKPTFKDGALSVMTTKELAKQAGKMGVAKYLGKGVLNWSKNSLSEGMEELAQGIASSTAKKYVEEIENPSLGSILTSAGMFASEIAPTLKSREGWDEFWAGFLTGVPITVAGKIQDKVSGAEKAREEMIQEAKLEINDALQSLPLDQQQKIAETINPTTNGSLENLLVNFLTGYQSIEANNKGEIKRTKDFDSEGKAKFFYTMMKYDMLSEMVDQMGEVMEEERTNNPEAFKAQMGERTIEEVKSSLLRDGQFYDKVFTEVDKTIVNPYDSNKDRLKFIAYEQAKRAYVDLKFFGFDSANRAEALRSSIASSSPFSQVVLEAMSDPSSIRSSIKRLEQDLESFKDSTIVITEEDRQRVESELKALKAIKKNTFDKDGNFKVDRSPETIVKEVVKALYGRDYNLDSSLQKDVVDLISLEDDSAFLRHVVNSLNNEEYFDKFANSWQGVVLKSKTMKQVDPNTRTEEGQEKIKQETKTRAQKLSKDELKEELNNITGSGIALGLLESNKENLVENENGTYTYKDTTYNTLDEALDALIEQEDTNGTFKNQELKELAKEQFTRDNKNKLNKVKQVQTNVPVISSNIKDNSESVKEASNNKGFFIKTASAVVAHYYDYVVSKLWKSDMANNILSTWLQLDNKSNNKREVEDKKADREKRRQEELKPLIEEKEQVEKEIAEIEQEGKEDTFENRPQRDFEIKAIQETAKMGESLLSMDSSVIGFKQLKKSIERLFDAFVEAGYKVVLPYESLDNYDIDGDINKLKEGNTVIVSPVIYYKGKLVKKGKIVIKEAPLSNETLSNNSEEEQGLKEKFKEIDEIIELDKNYSIEEIDTLLSKLPISKTTLRVYNLIKGLLNKLHLKISFNNEIQKSNGTFQLQGGIIRINLYSIFANPNVKNSQQVSNTIVHELIHGVTEYLHEGYVKRKDLQDKEIIEAFDELYRLFDILKKDKNLAKEYGLTNVSELLAELANPEFVEKLRNKKLEKNKTFLDKIYEAIISIFGIKKNTDGYSAIYDILNTLISNPNVKIANLYFNYTDKIVGKVDSSLTLKEALERRNQSVGEILQNELYSLLDLAKELGLNASISKNENRSTKPQQLKQRLDELNKKIDEINAKYDAERKALEGQQGEVSSYIAQKRKEFNSIVEDIGEDFSLVSISLSDPQYFLKGKTTEQFNKDSLYSKIIVDENTGRVFVFVKSNAPSVSFAVENDLGVRIKETIREGFQIVEDLNGNNINSPYYEDFTKKETKRILNKLKKGDSVGLRVANSVYNRQLKEKFDAKEITAEEYYANLGIEVTAENKVIGILRRSDFLFDTPGQQSSINEFRDVLQTKLSGTRLGGSLGYVRFKNHNTTRGYNLGENGQAVLQSVRSFIEEAKKFGHKVDILIAEDVDKVLDVEGNDVTSTLDRGSFVKGQAYMRVKSADGLVHTVAVTLEDKTALTLEDIQAEEILDRLQTVLDPKTPIVTKRAILDLSKLYNDKQPNNYENIGTELQEELDANNNTITVEHLDGTIFTLENATTENGMLKGTVQIENQSENGLAVGDTITETEMEVTGVVTNIDEDGTITIQELDGVQAEYTFPKGEGNFTPTTSREISLPFGEIESIVREVEEEQEVEIIEEGVEEFPNDGTQKEKIEWVEKNGVKGQVYSVSPNRTLEITEGGIVDTTGDIALTYTVENGKRVYQEGTKISQQEFNNPSEELLLSINAKSLKGTLSFREKQFLLKHYDKVKDILKRQERLRIRDERRAVKTKEGESKTSMLAGFTHFLQMFNGVDAATVTAKLYNAYRASVESGTPHYYIQQVVDSANLTSLERNAIEAYLNPATSILLWSYVTQADAIKGLTRNRAFETFREFETLRESIQERTRIPMEERSYLMELITRILEDLRGVSFKDVKQVLGLKVDDFKELVNKTIDYLNTSEENFRTTFNSLLERTGQLGIDLVINPMKTFHYSRVAKNSLGRDISIQTDGGLAIEIAELGNGVVKNEKDGFFISVEGDINYTDEDILLEVLNLQKLLLSLGFQISDSSLFKYYSVNNSFTELKEKLLNERMSLETSEYVTLSESQVVRDGKLISAKSNSPYIMIDNSVYRKIMNGYYISNKETMSNEELNKFLKNKGVRTKEFIEANNTLAEIKRATKNKKENITCE